MSPVDETAARETAERFLETQVRPGVGEDVVITTVSEHPTCWVVGYNTRAFVETGSISHALAGGGPVIVNRKTGRARLGTSALPIEQQLDDA